GGLLPGVLADSNADALSNVDPGGAGVEATRGRERTERDAVNHASVELVTDIAADLHADIGARDVIEPHAVQGADLHVFSGFESPSGSNLMKDHIKIFLACSRTGTLGIRD